MVKIVTVIGSWLRSLSPQNFATAKQSISSALGMSTSTSKVVFLDKVTKHLKDNPMSYATILSSIGVLGQDLLSWAASSDISDKDLELINKILHAGDAAQLPSSSYAGADGNADTVNGVASDEFYNNALMVKNARDNIKEIGAILGISDRSVIELSMRLNAVEPQHATVLD
jgi:hypothetical protein